MRMEGSRRIAAPHGLVWNMLNDMQVLQDSVASCAFVEIADDGVFVATLKMKIGPVSATFTSRLTLANVIPGRSYTLGFDSQGGVAGFGRGTVGVSLEADNNGTQIHYAVVAEIGGKIAQVGQRLIDGIARKMAEDFFARFEENVGRTASAAG